MTPDKRSKSHKKYKIATEGRAKPPLGCLMNEI